MVNAKLITRKARTRAGGGNDTTEFYITGLINRATPYAVEKLKVIDTRRREGSERSKRRGLRLVEPNE